MSDKEITMIRHDKVAIISLNRPEKRNALNASLLTALALALKETVEDYNVRAVILKGEGSCFCAGGDLEGMHHLAQADKASNYQDAHLLADVLYQLHTLPKPVIALAHGKVLGGGVGLIAAADIVLTSDDAVFAFPEANLGLTPSIVSPYIVAAIGERLARYYFLTAKPMSAHLAHALHLVHEVYPATLLMTKALEMADSMSKLGRHALKEIKTLVQQVSKESITLSLAHKTAEHLADIRAQEEAREGMRAFLEKRKPNWQE